VGLAFPETPSPVSQVEDFDSDDEEAVSKLLRVKTKQELNQATVMSNRFSRGRKDATKTIVAANPWVLELPMWREKVALELDQGEVKDDVMVLSGVADFVPLRAPRYQNPLSHVFALRNSRPPAMSKSKAKIPVPSVAAHSSSTITHSKKEELGQFAKHPTKKGWFSCRQCDESVWPPNARKHAVTCEWNEK